MALVQEFAYQNCVYIFIPLFPNCNPVKGRWSIICDLYIPRSSDVT